LAGRVSLQRRGHPETSPTHSDPGDTLELGARHASILDWGSGWQIHPRVSLLYLIPPGIDQQGPGLISVPAADNDLSALSILADYLEGKLKARDAAAAGKSLPPPIAGCDPCRCIAWTNIPAASFAWHERRGAHHLIEQLKAHTMKREYVAFVEGRSAQRHARGGNGCN